jgi:hypothetical protein
MRNLARFIFAVAISPIIIIMSGILLMLDYLSTIYAAHEAVQDDEQQPTHPGCKGCKYWYGRKDGGKLLVCAIHPGGHQPPCPDKKMEGEV